MQKVYSSVTLNGTLSYVNREMAPISSQDKKITLINNSCVRFNIIESLPLLVGLGICSFMVARCLKPTAVTIEVNLLVNTTKRPKRPGVSKSVFSSFLKQERKNTIRLEL